MKILVTGATGQLGHDVAEELAKRGHEPIGVGSADMDITSEEQVRKIFDRVRPEAVVHCAAYTAVDRAEDEPELCRRINAEGTRRIARFCREYGCKLLYISTEYVFEGEGERPWEPDDTPNPLNVYGQSKYEGEQAVQECLDKYFIVRISWVFGLHGGNFVRTMLRLGRERGAVKVVDDQIGSPTYTRDLSILLADMAESEKYGIYHASNEGFCSWYEFAAEIFRKAGLRVDVTPVDSGSFPTKARRPHNSRINKDKIVKNGFNKLPPWQDALERYLRELSD